MSTLDELERSVERLNRAVERLNNLAGMTTVDPTPLDAYGRCAATFADLRLLLSERAELLATVEGMRQAALGHCWGYA